MKTLETLRQQLSLGAFEFSRHAFKRVVERNISEMEIMQAGVHARIIEDYPMVHGEARPVRAEVVEVFAYV